MDTQAYLRKHGWRGDGHSLDHTNRGIKKPLLVSKKVDVLGVGLNKHAAVSDQWWLRAFDEGLKNFGTGKESTLAAVQKHGVNRGGLYARFVQGEGEPGTIEKRPEISIHAVTCDSTDSESSESSGCKRKRKRKSDKLENNVATEFADAQGTKISPALKKASSKSKRKRNLTESATPSESEMNTIRPVAPEKLLAYRKRAKEKGVDLDVYIRRRVEKYAAKRAASKV